MNTAMFKLPWILATLLVVGLFAAESRADKNTAKQVRSLFSNRCFACHGPDQDKRQGGYRLDDLKSAFEPADSGERPIVAGAPTKSELLRRLTAEDESERMPPPEFGAKFSKEEVQLIEQWIRDGAKWEQHWSFVPPARPQLPEVKIPNTNPGLDIAWGFHPVDRFVLAKQLALGMTPSPPATKAELLRRLSLDLTGLPPTVDEVRLFEQDKSIDAFERQVDRVLASPTYGEHWARKWLDLARYADSAGYADDPPRTIWAYRDWVINALNDNQPLDQFTVEQLAGDLLPNPTESQLVATAFHRNTLTNNEGGTNDEEFRNVAIVDRVNTTMAVWMGITMNCAQCHTHKFDPFTQEEYFKLFAIFNQSQDADRKDETPTIELYTAEQRRNRQQWQQRISELQSQVEQPTAESAAEFAAWDAQLRAPNWQTLAPVMGESTGKAEFVLEPSGRVLVKPIGNEVANDNYTLQFSLPTQAVGKHLEAIAIRTVPRAELPSGGAGLSEGGNFVVTNLSATLLPDSSDAQPLPKTRFVRIELAGNERILSLAEVQVIAAGKNVALAGTASQSSTDFGGEAKRAIDDNTTGEYAKNSTTHTAISANPWWEVDLGSEYAVEQVVLWNRTDGGIQNRMDGAEVKLLDATRNEVSRETIAEGPKTSKQLQFQESQSIPLSDAFADYSQAEFDASAIVDGNKASGWAVGGQIAAQHLVAALPKQPVAIERPGKLRLEIAHGSSHRHHLLGSFEVLISTDVTARDWSMLTPELQQIQAIVSAKRSGVEQAKLTNFFVKNLAKSKEGQRAELADLQKRIAELKPETSVPILRDVEAKAHRETYVQLRGNYKSLGNKVTSGVPKVFYSFEPESKDAATGEPQNRLQLAKWLVDRRNPLTARVWVNRLWESLFGLGIVRTSEEFGSQGDAPTHPELLDWLASEFMDSGWDSKLMLRMLVTSQTYRQTSQVTEDGLIADRENIWLSRGPRVRLSAEMVRDQALAISGLLASKMYGAPVRPPQPNMGLTAAFGGNTDWMTSEGEDRYRRGVYTTWRRSNPYPSMATFDAPSREVCTLRRDSTNTPLQALVTLNDPGFVEAAQALARRVVMQLPNVHSDAERLQTAFEWCTSRDATLDELRPLGKLLDRARHELKANPEAAKQLATEPLGKLPESADTVELAAWTAVCNVLLNLDEVLMKR